MATTVHEAGHRIALDEIRVPENVRSLDGSHVQALAGSIALQGMLVPLVVRTDGDGFELVAGFHRIAAARSLGLADVPVVIREAKTEDADRAVENITRKQLNPYEEAKAVHAMLDRGLSEDGAAQALGWPKARVTARVKILELPERAQQLIGEAIIHLAAVDQLRAIGTVAPELLDAVIAYLDDGNAWAAERLTREPGWVLDAALTHAADSKVFAAYLHSASAHEIAELRLGKKAGCASSPSTRPTASQRSSTATHAWSGSAPKTATGARPPPTRARSMRCSKRAKRSPCWPPCPSASAATSLSWSPASATARSPR
jgi:ParB/RepB/Spo0J family partition protein